MKITIEIPIEPRQKYCVDKKPGEECLHVMGTGWNEYICNLFFCGLETSPTGSGYSIRCKQCKEAGK